MRLRHAPGIAILAGAVIGAPDTRAHHSFAPHFDSSKPVSIYGTITRFEAQNPHSYVHIDAVDEPAERILVAGPEGGHEDVVIFEVDRHDAAS